MNTNVGIMNSRKREKSRCNLTIRYSIYNKIMLGHVLYTVAFSLISLAGDHIVESACDVPSDQLTLQPPGGSVSYPHKKYGKNKYCIWTFNTSTRDPQYIQIEFVRFDIGAEGWLDLPDRSKHTGKNLPQTTIFKTKTSPCNAAPRQVIVKPMSLNRLEFRSGNPGKKKGFELQYTIKSCYTEPKTRKMIKTTTTTPTTASRMTHTSFHQSTVYSTNAIKQATYGGGNDVSTTQNSNVGTIVAIILGIILAIVIVLMAFFCIKRHKKKDTQEVVIDPINTQQNAISRVQDEYNTADDVIADVGCEYSDPQHVYNEFSPVDTYEMAEYPTRSANYDEITLNRDNISSQDNEKQTVYNVLYRVSDD